MAVTANIIALELNKTLKTVLKNSKVNYENSLSENIESFKTKIETAVIKNLTQLKKAFGEYLENLKTPKNQQERILNEVSALKSGIFQTGFEKIEKGDGKIEIKINFKNSTAKSILKLYDLGSGTFGVPTTRIVFKVCEEMREELGGIELKL